MGKIIDLPFTCKQLQLASLIGFPLMFIISVIGLSGTVNDSHPFYVILLALGIIGSVMIWVYKILDWSEKGEFPSFKCKCDNDG